MFFIETKIQWVKKTGSKVTQTQKEITHTDMLLCLRFIFLLPDIVC